MRIDTVPVVKEIGRSVGCMIGINNGLMM